MSMQDMDACAIHVSNGDDESVISSIVTDASRPRSPTARIPTVPAIVRETQNYDKYYVPKVVSIGPYHFGNPKLKLVENLKPFFTMELLGNDTTILSNLYKNLGEAKMVEELRSYYEERSTQGICDKSFTKMMILDGCFLLYYILGKKVENCRELKSHHIAFLHQDLFLLENQIPFRVLFEVMKVAKIDNWSEKIKPFIDHNILVPAKSKNSWFCGGSQASPNPIPKDEEKKGFVAHHLLHLLHHSLNTKDWDPNPTTDFDKDLDQTTPINPSQKMNPRCTFRNVNELNEVGIHFKQSESRCLSDIRYFKSRWWWWWRSAQVELPRITVDDSTKPMLLNLIALEMCLEGGHEAWVTSYICLLDSLIDHPEDVKALRKAGVLENSLGSDQEVSKLFNEIGTDLVPNDSAYLKAKQEIQRHYDSRRNNWLSQLKHEYIKSPWAFFATLGAVLALALSGVQTYYSSLEGECDGLCKFLKVNHHL